MCQPSDSPPADTSPDDGQVVWEGTAAEARATAHAKMSDPATDPGVRASFWFDRAVALATGREQPGDNLTFFLQPEGHLDRTTPGGVRPIRKRYLIEALGQLIAALVAARLDQRVNDLPRQDVGGRRLAVTLLRRALRVLEPAEMGADEALCRMVAEILDDRAAAESLARLRDEVLAAGASSPPLPPPKPPADQLPDGPVEPLKFRRKGKLIEFGLPEKRCWLVLNVMWPHFPDGRLSLADFAKQWDRPLKEKTLKKTVSARVSETNACLQIKKRSSGLDFGYAIQLRDGWLVWNPDNSADRPTS